MALKAVLFDLDGTLLAISTQELMDNYLRAIAQAVAPLVAPGVFVRALLKSTEVMLQDQRPHLTNEEVFWADFSVAMGDLTEPLKPVLDDFYATQFPLLGRDIKPAAPARRAVEVVLERGLRIVVATNPVFPQAAIRHRLDWAGVSDLPWELVTTYEIMHACKPQLAYYHEIAAKLHLDPAECLMVGNDRAEDVIAVAIGMTTGLVTDYLIDDQDAPAPHWVGTVAQLPAWLETAGE